MRETGVKNGSFVSCACKWCGTLASLKTSVHLCFATYRTGSFQWLVLSKLMIFSPGSPWDVPLYFVLPWQSPSFSTSTSASFRLCRLCPRVDIATLHMTYFQVMSADDEVPITLQAPFQFPDFQTDAGKHADYQILTKNKHMTYIRVVLNNSQYIPSTWWMFMAMPLVNRRETMTYRWLGQGE